MARGLYPDNGVCAASNGPPAGAFAETFSAEQAVTRGAAAAAIAAPPASRMNSRRRKYTCSSVISDVGMSQGFLISMIAPSPQPQCRRKRLSIANVHQRKASQIPTPSLDSPRVDRGKCGHEQ